MSNAPPRPLALVLSALAIITTGADPGPGPFARFNLPDEWEAKFWADPDTKALLALDPKDLARGSSRRRPDSGSAAARTVMPTRPPTP